MTAFTDTGHSIGLNTAVLKGGFRPKSNVRSTVLWTGGQHASGSFPSGRAVTAGRGGHGPSPMSDKWKTMIESVCAISLASNDMGRAVRFYPALGCD